MDTFFILFQRLKKHQQKEVINTMSRLPQAFTGAFRKRLQEKSVFTLHDKIIITAFMVPGIISSLYLLADFMATPEFWLERQLNGVGFLAIIPVSIFLVFLILYIISSAEARRYKHYCASVT
jgi:hypothetical protein